MQSRSNHTRTISPGNTKTGRISRAMRAGACLMALGAATVPCDFSQEPTSPSNTSQPRQTVLLPETNRLPDANAQMKLQQEHVRKVSFEAANAERKRQLTDDSAALLQLAQELKAELDKTNKDTLSLDVVRKSEEIAKLAHNVQVKMKLTLNAAY